MKRELPIRLANTIMELNYLPLVITKQKMFQDVLQQYLQSFKELVAISGRTRFWEKFRKIFKMFCRVGV